MPQRQGHDPYDNAGPNIRGLGKDNVTAQEELTAFDQLGPLTRKVISEIMCVPWSSHKVLQAIKKDWRADPLNPSVDREVAEMLLRANAEVAAQIQQPVPHTFESDATPWRRPRGILRSPGEAAEVIPQNGSENFS